MKTKNLIFFFIAFFASIILILFSKQLNAQNYQIVYMDSVARYDTIYVCDTYDSIKFIPCNCEEFIFWRAGYINNNGDYQEDSIYSDTLYLPTSFNGTVDYQGRTGIDECGNFIFITPIILLGEDKSGSCGSLVSLNIITNFYPPGDLIYSWSPTTGLSDPSIPNPILKVTGDVQYTVTLNAPNGCVVSKNINVTLQPMSSPSICLVSVDTINKNIVYWEKPVSVSIDSFFIYKETNMSNVYKKIGAIGYNDNSFYIDTSSFPLIQSNKYKISFKDSCNLESDLSIAHKTIHLTISQGLNNSWNLIWEPYEGFEVSTYYIYRGTNSKNFQLIGSTAGSSTQYTDFTAPVGYVFYQIEVVSPTVCNISDLKSTQVSINTSRSNIATNSPTGFEDNAFQSSLLCIYPNPSSSSTVISYQLPVISDVELSIYDLLGKKVVTLVIERQQPGTYEIEWNAENMKPGIYYCKLQTAQSKKVMKMILLRE
jgi:hypothetical protein